MAKVALFPGSFDPITVGHYDIILRSLDLFDKIIIGVGTNSNKHYLYSLQDRVKFIENSFRDIPQISVKTYSGLTINFCREINAKFILRGLRTAADFEFERAIAQMNNYLDQGIETVFILSSPQYTPISSTIIRDIIRNGGDAKAFVPDGVKLS